MPDVNLNPDTEEEQEQKDTERFVELKDKPDKTVEEKTEFEEISRRYGQRVEKRLKKAHWEKEAERERREAAEKRAQELEQEVEELKKPKEPQVKIKTKKQVVTYDGQEFFSDATLDEMSKAGEITTQEAYEHQNQRIEAAASDRAYKRLKRETTEEKSKEILISDLMEIGKSYPHFAKILPDGRSNPDYNPADPLFQEMNRILTFMDINNPRRFNIALKEAKRNLGISDNMPDATGDLSVHTSSAPTRSRTTDKRVELTEDDKEIASRLYRDIDNPATGRKYTEKEAIEKYRRAKEERLESRRR